MSENIIKRQYDLTACLNLHLKSKKLKYFNNPQMKNCLARKILEHNFDLRQIIKTKCKLTICAYKLSKQKG